MARIDWMHDRLLNWQRWMLMQGSGVLGYAAVNLSEPTGDRTPYAEAPIPTNAIEAGETNDAVQRLPSELKRTVIEYYTGKGGESDHLRVLCCAKATLHARLERADRLLVEHFSARRERADAERARVESLARSAAK